ncbi:hypothetical protein I3760_05G028400 [Carya illinoinensis]|nr:hypothetical protein I3760_05G028400 [Carya illinoinensis]
MTHALLRRWRPLSALRAGARSFRSDAALEALSKASEDKVPNLVLYNYPSFSGAFSALFAHLFHSRLNLPCLILPFSSVEPLWVEDLYIEGLKRCYLLDFLGPKGFAMKLAQRSSCDLLDPKDQDRMEIILKFIEDGDLRRWSLADIRAFNIGLREWRSRLNCITNPYVYEQLLELSSNDLITKGNSYMESLRTAAHNSLGNVFKVQLGRGLYGVCLGVKVDQNSNLIDEIGKQLSVKSAAAGLRPIGAVVYMQRKNLKMCLRSTDDAIDTSEVAKAYGGGGSPSSSSFIIRMDEYNQWLA